MAATVSNVDTTSSLGSGSTVVATGVTANVGDWLVVAVSADNNGTSGAASLTTTLTESAGNTATNQGGIITASAAGVALDGISLGIWTIEVTAAITSGTITANFSPNTAAKMIAVQRVEPGAGETISLISVGAGDTGQAAQASITATGVESGDIVFGCCAIESNTMGTADSDTTNGSWSTQYGVGGTNTTALAGASVQMQYKTVSATGDQTYNVGNVATDRQWAINYIVLRSAAGSSQVGLDLELLYKIAGLAGSNNELLYSVRGLASASSQVLYKIAGLANKDVQLLYAILAAEGVVGAELQALYKIRALASANTQLLYKIRNTVALPVQLLYKVAGLAGASSQVLYKIAGLTTRDVQLLYRSRQLSTADINLLYRIAVTPEPTTVLARARARAVLQRALRTNRSTSKRNNR